VRAEQVYHDHRILKKQRPENSAGHSLDNLGTLSVKGRYKAEGYTNECSRLRTLAQVDDPEIAIAQ